MIYLLLFIGCIYVPTVLWLVIGMIRLRRYKTSDIKPVTKFSIIIPFRNEERQLPALIHSLKALTYPPTHFEVIFVNDASEDQGESIINLQLASTTFPICILQNKRNSGSPKKDAITTAIEQASYDWIITTDADCEVPSTWLHAFDQMIQKEVPMMVCGPVVYMSSKKLIHQFQFLDGISLQGATMGTFGWKQPLLCNGANLAYQKAVFTALDGFSANDHIASGDDIFLLEKMQTHYPNNTYHLNNKDAVVITQPERSWFQVFQQRIRWASKTTQQQNSGSKILGLVVLLGNFTFLVSLVFYFFDNASGYLLWPLLGLKIATDLALLRLTAHYLGRSFSFLQFAVIALIYPPMTVWIVLRSLNGTYEWKGRKFNK